MARLGLRMLGIFLFLVGLVLIGGGGWLIALGGSPYYLLAGIGCLTSGVLIARGKLLGALVYGAVLVGTIAWALWEVGLDFWQLLPRIGGPLAIGLGITMFWVLRPSRGASRRAPLSTGGRAKAAVVTVALLAATGGGVVWFVQQANASKTTAAPTDEAGDQSDDWTAYGRTLAGTRYSPAGQITPENVSRLKVAWTYRTGDIAANYPKTRSAFMFQATPLKVGDLLYFCTPHNIVVALDAGTGKERWRYDPKTNDASVAMLVCRGVSYYASGEPLSDCPARILVSTIDARMIALDSRTGKPCRSFGNNGEISLRDGLGPVKPGFHYATSPATIIGNAAVIGGFVLDGMDTKEPSGVVRAFDARDGKLLWAWDIGRAPGALKPGEIFTPGTPNAWTLFSADPKLGLVYIPTGNSTPDFYGVQRPAVTDRYSSSVVALDAQSGAARWSFQTVHHDLWDYDIGSQPVLVDLPTPAGSVPALIQPTKHGEIYLLDRRNGKPLARVEERPAPRGNIAGERYSPTQPWSIGMPSFTPPPLTEKGMWGATPIDQLWCRIQFRRLDYKGKFTPPAAHWTLQYPGNFGVIDWGSVAVDEGRRLMVVNTSYMPMVVRLVPRAEANKRPSIDLKSGHVGLVPQAGTPYAVDFRPFFSPLGLPCNAPPWGKLFGVDLASRKIAWESKLGTSADHAPLGIAVPGVFNLGGSVVTRGGVTFIGATIDNYLRAFDTRTGQELWKGRLPAGGQASPMTYAANGRQYVVIAAGGHKYMGTTHGDYIVAYALPD